MAKVLCGGISGASLNMSFVPIGDGRVIGGGTSEVPMPMRVGGTVSYLAASVINAGTSRVGRLRKNLTNVTNILDLGSSSALTVYDTTHTDSYAAGDTLSSNWTSSSGSFSTYWQGFTFEADGGLAIGFVSPGALDLAGTSYATLQGNVGFGVCTTTESQAQCLMRTSGRVQNCIVLVGSTASSTVTNFKIRKNGADGNTFISVPASTNGTFEDLTHTDTFVAGDRLCWQISGLSGSMGAQDFFPIATIAYDAGQAEIFAGEIQNIGGTLPITFFGPGYGSSFESNAQRQFGFAGTLSRLRTNVNRNESGSTTTVRVRKNTANGNQVVSITGSATGYFEDTTHTDVFAANDNMNFNIAVSAAYVAFTVQVSETPLATSLAANNLSAGSPTFGKPAYAKNAFDLIAVFVPHSPVFDTPAINQKCKLVAANLTVARPFIQIPGLTGLTAAGLGVGSPVIGAPILTHPWGIHEPIPTLSAQLDEAEELLNLVLDGLIKSVPTRIGGGRPAWDFRRQVGIVRADGKQMIFLGTLGTPLVQAFGFATAAGATLEAYERLRQLIIAQEPFSLPAQATAHLALQGTLAQMSFIAAKTAYKSRDEAFTALKRISEAYAPAEEDVADEADPMMYRALVAARAASVRDLAERGRQLPRVIIYSFATPMTGLWIAHRLYDDATRFEELRDENNWIHPAFCPEEGRYLSRHDS
jgi:hypothetical protein